MGSDRTGGTAEGAELYAFAASLSPKLQDHIVQSADSAVEDGPTRLVVGPYQGRELMAEAGRAAEAMPRVFSRRPHQQEGIVRYRLDPKLVAAVRRAREDRLSGS